MKWTIAGLILVGIAASLSAAVLAASLRANSSGDSRALTASLTEREILVATRDIPAMSVVDAASVAIQKVHVDEAPPDALTNVVQVIGQVLISPLVEGQAFRGAQFASDGSNVHLASALPEGSRAMSILLPDNSGIEGLLYPGSIVDVVASFRIPTLRGNRGGEIVSATLLQGIQVLAIGPRSIVTGREDGNIEPADRRSSRMVTLMVDPEQAEALQLAMVYGSVSLALRNPLDNTEADGGGVLMSDLSEELARRISAISELSTARPPMTPEEIPATAAARGAALPGGSPANSMAPTGDTLDASSDDPAAAPAVPVWTTVLMRGRNAETLTFPIPGEEEDNEASDG